MARKLSNSWQDLMITVAEHLEAEAKRVRVVRTKNTLSIAIDTLRGAADELGEHVFRVAHRDVKLQIADLIHKKNEPLIKRGEVHAAGSRSGGDARRELEQEKWGKWKREAIIERIKDPTATKRQIAELISNRHAGDKFYGKAETIRKKI